MVAELRAALDPTGVRQVRDIVPFDVVLAHALYGAVFAEVAPLLEDATHVLLVPDGPLQSLPFSILVTEEPAGPVTAQEDYAEVPWLGRK